MSDQDSYIEVSQIIAGLKPDLPRLLKYSSCLAILITSFTIFKSRRFVKCLKMNKNQKDILFLINFVYIIFFIYLHLIFQAIKNRYIGYITTY